MTIITSLTIFLVISSFLANAAYYPPYPQQQPQPMYNQQPPPYYHHPEPINPLSKKNIGRYLAHKITKPLQHLSGYHPQYYGNARYQDYYIGSDDEDDNDYNYYKMERKQMKAEQKLNKMNEMMQMMMLMSMNPNANKGELAKLMMYSMAPKEYRRIMELTMMNTPMSQMNAMSTPYGTNSYGVMGMGSMYNNPMYNSPMYNGSMMNNPMGMMNPSMMMNQSAYSYLSQLPIPQQQQLFSQLYSPKFQQMFNSPLAPYQVPGCSPSQLQSLGLFGNSNEMMAPNLNINGMNSACLPYLLEYMRNRDMRRRLYELERYDYERPYGGSSMFSGGRTSLFGSMGRSSDGYDWGHCNGNRCSDYNMMRSRCFPNSRYGGTSDYYQQQQTQMMQQQLAQQQAMLQQQQAVMNQQSMSMMNQAQPAQLSSPQINQPAWRRQRRF